jgi:hypothetical protein
MVNQWGFAMAKQRKIERLRDAFMACDTMGEVQSVVLANLEFMLMNKELFTFSDNALRRIDRVQVERTKSWDLVSKN